MQALWRPTMTIGSGNYYLRNHAGSVANSLYWGRNPKLESGVFRHTKNL
jgi:hypothetical protein